MNDLKNYTRIGVIVVIALLLVTSLYRQLFAIKSDFPVGKNFVVNENESLLRISERLEEEKYISSPLLFRAGVSLFGKDRSIQLGGYTFDRPLSLFGVVTAFVDGKPSSPLLSITIPEGSTSAEIAKIIAKAAPGITADIFSQVTERYAANGKLFPSTYYLLPSYTAEDVIKVMLSTFSKRIATLSIESRIRAPLSSEHDVLVLASILEGEAKTEEDMKIVAGILLKRLSLGMPLQVDVAMETYKQKGLPQEPINNPGLTAIQAVLSPIETPYLFYITGNDGNMYYAKTFDEHKKNIKKYLK
jgi:UPF0755 protein